MPSPENRHCANCIGALVVPYSLSGCLFVCYRGRRQTRRPTRFHADINRLQTPLSV